MRKDGRDRDAERERDRQARLKAKTRRNKKYGAAPSCGMGRIKCEVCGKPLSKHDIMKLCSG